MRALVTADLHQGLARYSKPNTSSRFDDLAATLKRFAEVAIELNVDVALIVGDTFHGRRPAPRDLHALTSALRLLQRAHIKTVIVPGNHDGPDDVGDMRTGALEWMHALKVEGVLVLTEPFAGIVEYGKPPAHQFNLVAIPYPHKNSFDASHPDLTPVERVEEISRAVENAIAVKIEQVKTANPTLPTIFMGHLSVIGAQIGTEMTMRFGMDVTIRSAILDQADFAALGHIHRQQKVGAKGWYAGSPEYMDFGEMGQQKGFLLAKVEPGEDPEVTIIDSKPRPLAEVDIYPDGSDWKPSDAPFPDGAILLANVHETVEQPLSQADKAKLIRLLRTGGASYVKVNVITPDVDRLVRLVVDQQVEKGEAVRGWLAMEGHSVEPALSVALGIISEVGEAS